VAAEPLNALHTKWAIRPNPASERLKLSVDSPVAGLFNVYKVSL
jgi:hypothetical protein